MPDKPKSKRRNMKSFKLEEISVVDKPAQEGAKMAIMKRKDEPLSTKLLKYYLAKGSFADPAMVQITKSAGGKTAAAVWPGFAALDTSLRSIVCDASLDDVNKVEMMKSSVGDFLTFTKQRLPEIEPHLLKAVSSSEDDGMNLRQLQKQMGALSRKLDSAIVRMEKSAAVDKAAEGEAASTMRLRDVLGGKVTKEGTMPYMAEAEAEKASEEELPAFMEAEKADEDEDYDYGADEETEKVSEESENEKPTSEGEEEEMIAGGSPRPIGGKRATKRERLDDDDFIKVGARVLRKSAIGEDLFEVLKAQEDRVNSLAKRAQDERDLRELVEFTKVAEDELPHLPGTAEEKAVVLKHLSGVLDAKERVILSRMLKAGNAGISAAFETVGHRVEKVAVAGTFEKRVNDIRARDNCTHTAAMQKARREHPDDFAAYQGH